MSRVFIGGSRRIPSLNDDVRSRLDAVMAKGLDIIIGDANGADKAVQTYLARTGYQKVTLYCSGQECRNAIGNWPVRHVQTSSITKDANHYAEKDKEMAKDADYGLFLWDGASKGTLQNIRRMVDQKKPSLVYLSNAQSFLTIKTLEDFKGLPAAKAIPKAARRRRIRLGAILR